jgi:DNA polymerase III sliding clamp (beta) subunit (PCNA family)
MAGVKVGKEVKAIIPLTGCVNMLSKMVGHGASMVTIDFYAKEKVVFKAGQFELRVRCIDAQFPNTDAILTESKACKVYSIAGLEGAIKHLKQFANRDNTSVHLYENKAKLNEGVYDSIVVKEIKPGHEEHVKGTDFNPCLITMTMTNDAKDGTIMVFNLKYLEDALAITGSTAKVFLNNKEVGYSYWTQMKGMSWL